MKNVILQNVSRPKEFQDKLQNIIADLFDLFELARESDLPCVTKDGVITYDEEAGKTCFQASGQYSRPSEFLQTLLDIIRVNFEPSLLGTFFLNSNPGLMYDEIPDKPFQLGYASLISGDKETFGAFYTDTVIPYLKSCGYFMDDHTSAFFAVSTGPERYGMHFIEEVNSILDTGISMNEALTAMGLLEEASDPEHENKSYTGYCLDSALGNRVRLSLWIFIRWASIKPDLKLVT